MAEWQLTSDAPCSSWSLFNKLDPPISSRPSGLSLWLPAPLAWPWCRLHVGVPRAPVTTGYIHHKHAPPTPTPTLPVPSGLSGGWPGRPLVRAGFFRPRSLPCLLHLISSSLHPSVSLPSQTVKACEGHTLSLHVPVCASLFLAPSLGVCSLVCSVCGALLLIRWLLPCLLCGEQSSCTSETLEAEWSLKVCSLSAGECFWPAY